MIGYGEEEIFRTNENLTNVFLMKELGQLDNFLGLEIECTEEGIRLHQQECSKDLLKKFGMLNRKQISTRMDPNTKMCACEGKYLDDVIMYRQLVGSLIFLTLTTADISYVVVLMS